MATYKEIIAFIRKSDGFVAQTCWIADVKSKYGLTKGIAPNRHDARSRVKPCPPEKREPIERALRHFGMIPPRPNSN